jgi:uncharacterized membrane protein
MSEQSFPWRTLLFVSVALNLLAAGAVVGAIGAGVRVERAAETPQIPAPRVFIAALPQPTRAKMRVVLARTWAQTRDLRQQAIQARRDAYAAAAADPYDPARVRAAFARVRAADAATVAVFHDNIVAAFATLTPEERREALSALRDAAAGRRAAPAPAPASGRQASDEEEGAAAQPGAAPERPHPALREAIRERIRRRRDMAP